MFWRSKQKHTIQRGSKYVNNYIITQTYIQNISLFIHLAVCVTHSMRRYTALNPVYAALTAKGRGMSSTIFE